MKVLELVLVAALAACGREATPPVSSSPVVTLPDGLSRVVDASSVCMVTDRVMRTPQFPVVVNDRTYYGCCAMCKDRLLRETAARWGRDPATGEPVDKATALLIRDASGRVMYFASEATLRRFAE